MLTLTRFLVVAVAVSTATAQLVAAAELQLATFRVDVTPPVGDGPCVGFMPKVESIEHPLELRGVLLRTKEQTFVIAAIDFCGVCNSSDEILRAALATAAGTQPTVVALQSLHQHTAPVLDSDVVRILHGDDSEQLRQHLRFTDKVATDAATAITEAMKTLRPVTRIVGSRARVDRVASNRRVPQLDGSIGVRSSLTRDLEIRNAPEGLIDPWLRTVTFFDGEQKLTQMHYYATHPQSFYGDARVTYDTVGMARNRLELQSGVFQIYFNGCGGNITVGKYNDGTSAAREQLAGRLFKAMQKSANEVDVAVEVDVTALPADDIRWKQASLGFSVREDGVFHPRFLKIQLEKRQPFGMRLKAASFVAFDRRLRNGGGGIASRLRIGAVDLLHLPGEPFVEFQLYAQQIAEPHKSFVCVAGYGDCGVWYFGPDQIYADKGGYEQTWSLTGPCERSVKTALSTFLEDTSR